MREFSLNRMLEAVKMQESRVCWRMRVVVQEWKSRQAFVFGTLLLAACGGVLGRETIRSTVSSDAQVNMSSSSWTLKDPDSYEAMVFLPPEHNQLNRKRMPTDNIETKETKYPLLLYLHGAGEMRGELSDIISEGATGTPPVELAFGRAAKTLSERFVVVAPHTTEGWSVKLIGKFLDFLLSEKFEKCRLCLDPSRLYVTGHSMGGAGALHAATSARFAAAVPVAPSAAPRANLLEGVPIWAFHGNNDIIVPSSVSKDLIEELWHMGASKEDAKLTLYEDAPAPPGWPSYFGHASTIPAYATADLYDWLLRHRAEQ